MTETKHPLIEAIHAYLPSFAPRTIFDVGANVGQSSLAFAAAFADAAIYAFEPIAATFRQLEANTAANPAINRFRLALGRGIGNLNLLVDPKHSTGSRIANRAPKPGEHIENVPMGAGGAFCGTHGISAIDILKVDTEGHDLEVLIGFGDMLRAGRIGLVEAEVSMNPGNTKHVPLEQVKRFMESLGYVLFHIHEPTLDIAFSGVPVLRRCNVAFIWVNLAKAHRRVKAAT